MGRGKQSYRGYVPRPQYVTTWEAGFLLAEGVDGETTSRKPYSSKNARLKLVLLRTLLECSWLQLIC